MSYAVPQVNWSPLGNLIDTFQGARDQQAMRSLGSLVGPDGSPDYAAMAQTMFRAGNADAGLRLSQLAEGRNAYRSVLPMLGQAPSAPQAPVAPVVPGTAPGTPPNLINSESGGNFRAQNSAVGAGGMVGHFGRLQFGQARLQEAAAAGAIPPGTSPQQFMADPQLQQRAEQWHFADIDAKIQQNGLDRFVGQQINGVPITIDGMRAVAHLGGSEGLRRFLLTGGRYNPRDANGTSLMDYLGRHATRAAQAPAGQPSAGQPSAAEVVDQMWNNRQQFNYAAPRSAPADTLDGGDGASGLGAPAMSPMEAFAAAGQQPQRPQFDQIARAGMYRQPTPVSPAMAPAPSMDSMMAGDQVTPPVAQSADGMMAGPFAQAPTQAPVPMARPIQAAAQAPMPQPRPNIEPPPQAQPAMAPQNIIAPPGPAGSERERLMLLRDEQSLAPGEADRLRQSLPGAAMPVSRGGQQMSRPAQPQAAPQTPAGGPLSALAQGPATQAPQTAQAPQGTPQQSQTVQAPQDMVQRIMVAMANPALPDSARQALAAQLQRLQPDLQIVARPDGSVWAIDKRNPQNARPIITGTAALVSWQPIKDEAQNITGFYNPQTMEIRDARGQPVQQGAPQGAPPPSPGAAPATATPQAGPQSAPASPAPQTGQTGLPMNRTAFQRQQEERRQLATSLGIREGTDEFKFLMANGRVPTAGEKTTEQQSKDLVYHRRGALALEVLDGPVDPNNPQSPRLSDTLTSGVEGAAGSLPMVGNYLKRDVYQRAEQAGRNFLAAILRKDTGAAITAQEMTIYGATFLPQPGDSPGVLTQKAEARRQALEAIKAGLGTAEAKAIGEAAIRESGARSRGQQPNAALGPGVSRADLEAEARRRGLIQ